MTELKNLRERSSSDWTKQINELKDRSFEIIETKGKRMKKCVQGLGHL